MSTEAALFIAAAALIGNAFFVGAEFGLISARRSSIELRALKGSRRAKITLSAMERVSFMLAGAQLGVTLCSLILGAVGEPLIAHALERPFHNLGISEAWIHPISFALALIVMVYLHVVIGEMVPKNLALAGPERTALLLTPPLAFIVNAIRPVVSWLNTLANGTLRLVGVTPKDEIASSFTRDEVAGFVEESRREGLLSEDEEHLLSGVLRFDQHTIQSIMMPITALVVAPAQASATDIEQLTARTGFSRFPVRGDDGSLVGYLHLKDILTIDADHYDQPLPVARLRALPQLGERTTLRSALTTMQRSGAHLAQVTTSKGELRGIVALEDVLEELVGTIRDDSQTT